MRQGQKLVKHAGQYAAEVIITTLVAFLVLMTVVLLTNCGPKVKFITVRGDKGDTGSVGAQGAQGEAGAQGPQGEQGPAGLTSHMLVTEQVAASLEQCVYGGSIVNLYRDLDDSLTVSEADAYWASIVVCNDDDDDSGKGNGGE